MKGHPVTEREINSILRLAGYETMGGEWVHSYASIAKLLDLHETTVARQIRQAAVAWGRHTRWRAEDVEL